MKKDLEILTYKQIKEKLKNFPRWKYKNHKISREFAFPTFTTGIELIIKLAPFCEKIDHHPDIHIYYKKILFELTSFSAGAKVTKRDFEVAQKIEDLFKKYGK